MKYKQDNIKQNFLREVFIKSHELLNNKERFRLKLNILISFFAGLLEILSVTTFYPLISVIIEPEILEKNKFIKNLWAILGTPSDNKFVILMVICISSLVIISTLFNLLSQLLAVREASSIQERYSKELYTKIINSPYLWHLTNNPNVIRNIFLNNLQLWNKNLLRVIPFISGQISGILFAFLCLIITTPKLGLLLVILSGSLLTILLKIIRIKSSKLMDKVREKEELINIFITETLYGIKDIKLSSRKNNFIKVFFKLNHIIIKNYASASNWNLLPSFLVVLFGQLGILITAASLFVLGIRGGELAAIMAIIVLVFAKLIPLLNRLGSSLNNIANISKWIEKIYSVQESLNKNTPQISEENISKKIISWRKVIFSKVDYVYPKSTHVVFKNLNLEIKKGYHYAFVGYSGSGKTTAIDLFLGLLEPTGGEILIDGKDIKNIGYQNWQKIINYVPQNPLILSSSLRENIAFGVNKEDIDDKRVINCLKQTGIYEMSRQLRNGIYTELGNDGISLSGGQKQRVAISRALYNSPEILILDEATSAMDAETEKAIQKTIQKLSKTITIISIAHRFSTIKNCDIIFLLNKGKISAKGSYEYLSTQSNLFRNLASEQIIN